MIKKVFSFCKKDAIIGELAYNTRKIFFIVIGLVFSLLFFFKPFSLDRLLTKNQLIIDIGCSVMAGLGYVISVSIFMPFKREKWTVFMEFITVLTAFFLSWLLIYFYLDLCFKNHLPKPFYIDETIVIPQGLFYKTLFYTLGTGTFVYLLLFMYNRFVFYKENPNSENNLKYKVTSKNRKDLKLIGKNKNEHLIIDNKNFILAKSEGHYIKIYYLMEKNLKSYIIRNTMKNIELVTSNYHNIYRCHKSFLLNLNYVKSIIGNSNKSHIYTEFYPEKIPISKEKISYLKEVLKTEV